MQFVWICLRRKQDTHVIPEVYWSIVHFLLGTSFWIFLVVSLGIHIVGGVARSLDRTTSHSQKQKSFWPGRQIEAHDPHNACGKWIMNFVDQDPPWNLAKGLRS